MSEENGDHVLRAVVIGSDNLGLCAGPEASHRGRVHPRQHGCFPRVVGTYVRDRSVLSWAEAIRKGDRGPPCSRPDEAMDRE